MRILNIQIPLVRTLARRIFPPKNSLHPERKKPAIVVGITTIKGPAAKSWKLFAINTRKMLLGYAALRLLLGSLLKTFPSEPHS